MPWEEGFIDFRAMSGYFENSWSSANLLGHVSLCLKASGLCRQKMNCKFLEDSIRSCSLFYFPWSQTVGNMLGYTDTVWIKWWHRRPCLSWAPPPRENVYALLFLCQLPLTPSHSSNPACQNSSFFLFYYPGENG